MIRSIPEIFLKQKSDMVEDHCKDPGDDQLEAGECHGDAGLSYFPVNGSKSCHTWNIKQAEDHQSIGVCCSESHGCKYGYHTVHTGWSRDICNAKEDAATGNNDFLGGDS